MRTWVEPLSGNVLGLPAGNTGATGAAGQTGATGAAGQTGAFSGTLTSNLDGAGYSISNFKTYGSASDIALVGATPTPTTASFPAVTISGLTASHLFQVTLGFRVGWYLDSNHASSWSGDLVIDASVSTDGSSVATVTFNTSPFFDTGRFPAAGGSCTATVAASSGGFTVSATGLTGTAGTSTNTHAWFECVVMKYRDIT